MKNDKSNISNHKLINNTDANSNEENKSKIITNNIKNKNNNNNKSSLFNAGEKENQNNLLNMNDLNYQIYS